MHFFFSGGKKNKLWTPSKITTALWLDAADVSTIILNGSTVSQWNDKSSNNRHLSQAVGSRQPQYNVADLVVNGKSSISSSSISGSIGLSASGNFSLQELYFISYYRGGTSSTFSEFATLFSGTGSFGLPRIMGNTLSADWINSSSLANEFYKNGLDVSSLVALPMPATIWRTVNTGGAQSILMSILFNAVSVDRGWVGGISEVIAFPATQSIENRQKIEGYLAHKWGLTADLPSNHPYKNKPPYV